MEGWFKSRRKDKNVDPSVVRAIEELRSLRVAALKLKYRELFGEDSRSSNKQFLFRRIAWRLQARVEGDLSERARHRAAEILTMRIFGHARRRASCPGKVPQPSPGRPTRRNLRRTGDCPLPARY
jgi:hypothetical protein